MKIKTDFITNSSSSSFIVAFDTPVKKFSDVEHLISRNDKAIQVLTDAKAQRARKIRVSKSLVSDIAEELSHGYEGTDYYKFQKTFCEREGIDSNDLYHNRTWMSAFYDEYNKVNRKIYTEKAVDFLTKNEGKYLYIFNYADEDGEFMGEMEHGFIFEEVPHITISKH